MMITVVLILVGIAATRYEKSVLRAREATLMQDCFVMRNAIQQYTLDKHTAPTSMDDLVRAEYLAAAPIDPITHEKLFGSRLRSWTRKLHGSRPDNSWC
jgi:type II secretory pathway pseudopilin PulG